MEILMLILLTAIFAEVTYLMIMKLRQRTLKVARGSMLLDTSAIMDGRIVDVAKTGFITAEIIVPRSVINELQLLADKADHDKRMRARAGLENVRSLQKLDGVSVTVVNDGYVGAGGVDERLLELAKKYDASICTTDYNLNKVAKVVGIIVVNVNELAQMLRAQYLPGETIELALVQPGANREQAVGYLDDGTMVVVENSKNLIGQKLRVEIIRSLQTEAGRMMFAERVKATAPKIKPASAFHSDQLKSPHNSDRQKPAKTGPKRPQNFRKAVQQNNQPRHLSAEDKMVQLANQNSHNNLR